MTNGRRYLLRVSLMTVVYDGMVPWGCTHVRLRDSLYVVCASDMSVTILLSPLTNSSVTVVKACPNSNTSRHVQQFYNFNCVSEPNNAVVGWGKGRKRGAVIWQGAAQGLKKVWNSSRPHLSLSSLLLFPSSPLLSFHSPYFPSPSSPFIPLEVGPPNPARGSGGAL